ncbi:T9SS type A sorting domain-containing protein [Cryomorpha ignava]|uniref:T9SS type A sorting domain-containing protein n=1 Tax=Cryomorpha ignava TaxID=101383 RepID=A0A7K3WSA3_9FLAO|nr:T9SS type A sorting domain-containing protein [Cryomorpha ignava]NEN24398.1 T9SS type A sorting domain-containing protein [Cryomorpha ignava]
MKTILQYTGILLTLLSGSAFGQWNSDPAAPIAVCTETGIQKGVQSFADGSGGIYTFWLDARTGNNQWDVYGQHYNEQGVPQWESGGKEIINNDGQINIFRILSVANGQFLIGWSVQYSAINTGNGVFVQRLNVNGDFVWSTTLKLRGDSNYTNGISNIAFVESAGIYYLASQATVIGGANVLRISKFDGDGDLLWPYGGTVPTSMTGFGGFGISSDNNGGLYVYHNNGNGSGAGMKCMLVAGESDLVNQWTAWTSVIAGSQGLNYQYSGIGDNTGITFVWQGSGPEGTSTNLYARRLLAANGSLGWNATTKLICVADGNQHNFYWKKSGSNYYITWADSRPGVVGNSAIYAQKFTTNGVILWEENGVEVADLNTYIPNPEFDLDENNTMCIAHKASPGFMAQKVTTDGDLVWDPAGVIALTNIFAPFYSDFNVVYTDGKFLVVSARSVPSGGADNIYISKVTLPAVQVTETVTACNEYTAYGQTFDQSDTYVIDLQDTVVTLQLTIVQNIAEISLDGNTLVSLYDGDFRWIDCNTEEFIDEATGPTYVVTESGSYSLEITNGDCVSVSDCVEVLVTTIEEKEAAGFLLYPNPGSEFFILEFHGTENPISLQVIDIAGRIVHSEKLKTSEKNHSVDLSSEAKGTYFMRIEFDNGQFGAKKWIKL